MFYPVLEAIIVISVAVGITVAHGLRQRRRCQAESRCLTRIQQRREREERLLRRELTGSHTPASTQTVDRTIEVATCSVAAALRCSQRDLEAASRAHRAMSAVIITGCLLTALASVGVIIASEFATRSTGEPDAAPPPPVAVPQPAAPVPSGAPHPPELAADPAVGPPKKPKHKPTKRRPTKVEPVAATEPEPAAEERRAPGTAPEDDTPPRVEPQSEPDGGAGDGDGDTGRAESESIASVKACVTNVCVGVR